MKVIVMSLVMGCLGGGLTSYLLVPPCSIPMVAEHLQVRSLEVVSASGAVVMRLSAHRGAGQIQLMDPTADAERGGFMSMGKDYLDGYGIGFGAPGAGPGLRLGVGSSGGTFMRMGDGVDYGESLMFGASKAEWSIHGMMEGDASIFEISGNDEGSTIKVGTLVDGVIQWRKL